jgi:hypothetical protein
MAKAKKTGTTGTGTTAARGNPNLAIPKLTLTMPLSEAKTKAIQRCIKKGTLKITISKVDLSVGSLGEEAWLYD